MGGYLWFLFISRDLSYRAALKITVSRRQNFLYQARGFEPQKWEALVHDANALRREIRIVAEEYDVDWDETKDLGGEEVKQVLEKENGKRKRREAVDDGDAAEADSEAQRKSESEGKKRDEKR
ncbi:hypothetical protein NUW58_g10759 [Xylaria curta]|uniref:Uncharacterized protein n=1 Tax=Xylaria curta TaxID=42375 RepID=A0ACC1MIG1_9PEZI|nr:hypothetical protein NUW58_g10759 [Xylaria curta]